MIIKEAKYKNVREWRRKEISPEVHGCDQCKKEIKEWPNEPNRLEVTVWPTRDSSETKHYHFCSWKCLLTFVPTIKSKYFASMPFLYFDEGKGDRTVTELKNIIKQLKW